MQYEVQLQRWIESVGCSLLPCMVSVQTSVHGSCVDFCAWLSFRLLCATLVQASVRGSCTAFVRGSCTDFCARLLYRLLCTALVQTKSRAQKSVQTTRAAHRSLYKSCAQKPVQLYRLLCTALVQLLCAALAQTSVRGSCTDFCARLS